MDAWSARQQDGKVATPPLSLAVKIAEAADGGVFWTPTSAVATFDGRLTPRMADRYRTQREGNLLEQVAATVFPTPRSSEWKHSGSPDSATTAVCERKHDLTGVVLSDCETQPQANRSDLRLHGLWVSRLMGFPDGWFDLSDDSPADQLDARWHGDPLNAFDDRWEDGAPRVAVGEPDRTSRLRALGNAVVPQVPHVILSVIAQQLARETSDQ